MANNIAICEVWKK